MSALKEQIQPRGHWKVTIRDPAGNVVDVRYWDNLVTDEGLDHLLEATLAGGTQKTSWFLGITDGTPTVAGGDTLGSAPGWDEVEAYDEGSRPTWSPGSVSNQSVSNGGSPASFTINQDGTTIGGAFLASDNTKGGASGILYAVGAFDSGDVTLSAGSTLEVTAEFTTERP